MCFKIAKQTYYLAYPDSSGSLQAFQNQLRFSSEEEALKAAEDLIERSPILFPIYVCRTVAEIRPDLALSPALALASGSQTEQRQGL